MKSILTFFSVILWTIAFSQHNWIRTNPGGGGAIATVGATADGTIVVASDLSGVFRSQDGGKSFDVVGANQGLIETHISSFGFHPKNGKVYFAGTYTSAYKTIDGGENFKLVFPQEGSGIDFSYIEDIVISSDSMIGYLTHHPDANAYGEVYKTTDGGETWHAITGNDFPDTLHLVKLMTFKNNPDIVYALTGKTRWGCSAANLYRSIDGGIHWKEIGSSLGDILDMDLHPRDSSIVFVSTFKSNFINNDLCSGDKYYVNDDNEYAGEFYKSTDGGLTFEEISDKTGIISVGIDNPDVIRLVDVLFPYDWYDDAGTWETKDGGEHWKHTGFVENWFKGFTENQYFTMSASFNGLNKTVTKDIFNPNRFYGSFGQWAWASFDGGKTLNNVSTREVSKDHWLSTGVENINGNALDVNDSNPDVIYIGGYDIGFWYTRNHGKSWSRTQPDYNIYPKYSWNLGDGIIESNIAKRGAGANVMTIISDPLRDSVVWASFSEEQLTDSIENSYASTGLFKSTNYGEDWLLLDDGLPEFEKSIRMYGLSIDRNSSIDQRVLYVTVDGDVYKSANGGLNWNLVLQNGGLKFTEVDNFNGEIVYAGGGNGLWRTKNGGSDWEEIGLVEMRKHHSNTRPDIVPTWIDWSDWDDPIYPWEGVFDIQSDPNVQGRVYVTVLSPQGGLYRSDDNGGSWSANLLPDMDMRGVSVAPENSDVIYVTSSKSYHSGGYGNSLGVQYSTDMGNSWKDANDGMAFNYAGMIEVESGGHPFVWCWSPGTGIQNAKVPYFESDNIKELSTRIRIFPNPVHDEITIEGGDIQAKYQLYSISGYKVSEGVTQGGKIDVSLLNRGVYLLNIFDKGNALLKVVKIVKEGK